MDARYLLYGIQIAEKGCIYDYGAANEYYGKLAAEARHLEALETKQERRDRWEAVRVKYQRITKDIHAQFDRRLPPKAKVPRAPRRRKRSTQQHTVLSFDTSTSMS